MKANRKTTRPVGVAGDQIHSVALPVEMNWGHLPYLQNIHEDQGGCGSCWAFATTTMLQANAEINGFNRTFSPQELVNCVPNPANCGGSGGCQGNIVELAMNWVVNNGLETTENVPYTGRDEVCGKNAGTAAMVSVGNQREDLEEILASGFHAASAGSAGASLGLKGWELLPSNQYEPLLRAVVERGPVAISAAASQWGPYGGGIFDSCGRNSIVNHAVTLIGYGRETDNYWIIRNSWGSYWGESGNIRVFRHDENSPDMYCGTDHYPEYGLGCDGGPGEVTVCGMCGILYDSVVAHFFSK